MNLVMIKDQRDFIILSQKSCIECAQNKINCEILSYYTRSKGNNGKGKKTLLIWNISKSEARQMIKYYGVQGYTISCQC